MDTQEPEGKRLTLADVVDRATREKGYPGRINYLEEAEKRGILGMTARSAQNLIVYDPHNLNLHSLKSISDDLGIDSAELSTVYGRNPFIAPIDTFIDSDNPLTELLNWYIEFRTGKSVKQFINDKLGVFSNYTTASGWFRDTRKLIPVKILKVLSKSLRIPEDELNQVYINPKNRRLTPFAIKQHMKVFKVSRKQIIKFYGSDPLVPPIDEFKQDDNPLGALLTWYIELRTGKKRSLYLKQNRKGLLNNAPSIKSWFGGRNNHLSKYNLNKMVEELYIPNEILIRVCGSDPLVPPIDEFKQDDNPLGALLTWYIELRTGKKRWVYFKEKEYGIIKSAEAAEGWIKGRSQIPVYYLKLISNDLQIPEEVLTKTYGRNPFKPPIDEFIKSGNALGNLIDWYIQFRTGDSRERYLQKNEGILFKHAGTAESWIANSNTSLFPLKAIISDLDIPEHDLVELIGRNPFKPPIDEFIKSGNALGNLIDWYIQFRTGKSRKSYLSEKEGELFDNARNVDRWIGNSDYFPLLILNRLTSDLEIPLEELTKIFGKNPFICPIEDFKFSDNPLGKLIDWYIDFRTGKRRWTYLKENESCLKQNAGTIEPKIAGRQPLPPYQLKLISDDLQIPYSEVNQFIDYDISDPLEVIVRTKNATPQQIIQSAFESMQIPTDSHSLYELVSSLGGDAEVGASELADILYLACPWQIGALLRKKIGRQEVKDFIKPHLLSDSGKSSGSGSGDLPPFLNITRVIPYESYQKEAALRSHLVDMALRSYMTLPYEVTMQRINAQLASQPDNKVLQQVLLETKDYLTKMNSMTGRMITVGN